MAVPIDAMCSRASRIKAHGCFNWHMHWLLTVACGLLLAATQLSADSDADLATSEAITVSIERESVVPVQFYFYAFWVILITALFFYVLSLRRQKRFIDSEHERIKERLDLQSAALDAAANGIVITDTNGSIEWANPAFAQMTGYSLDEVKGHEPGELLRSGEHDQAFYQKMWDSILQSKVWHGEVMNRRKDGTHYAEEMPDYAHAQSGRGDLQLCRHQAGCDPA
jgi:PAS domain S-box-containing protein